MMRKTNNLNKKGFTLLELIVVMAVAGMVITVVMSLMLFGFNVYGMTSNDHELQSNVRLAMENLGNTMRESKAVFAVPDAEFKDDGWNYLTVDDAGTTVVAHEWNGTDWDRNVMLGPYPDVTFDIVFLKENTMDKDNTVEMFIEAKTAGGSVQRFAISTGYQVFNALQVINYGTESNPAKALAYRMDEFHYANMKVYVNVALVLDTSGSMSFNLAGTQTSGVPLANRRVTMMKQKTIELIEQFATNTNPDIEISMALIQYNTHANNPNAFRNVTTNKANLITDVNNFCSGASQNCVGGTNIGDGLRRAYHSTETLKAAQEAAHSEELGQILIKNYVIVLSDGDYTMYSRHVSATTTQVTECTRYRRGECTRWSTYNVTTYDRSYFLGNGNILNTTLNSDGWTWFQQGYEEDNNTNVSKPTYVVGFDGRSLDPRAKTYIDLVGGLGLNNNDRYINYIIGFTPSISGTALLNIQNALSIDPSRAFTADNADELGLAFTNIKTSITNDSWHYMGPRLSD